jgi:hypothetical protein
LGQIKKGILGDQEENRAEETQSLPADVVELVQGESPWLDGVAAQNTVQQASRVLSVFWRSDERIGL